MAQEEQPTAPPWPGPLGPALPFLVTAFAYVVGLIAGRMSTGRGVGEPVLVFVGLPLAWGLTVYVKRSRSRLAAAAAAVCIAGLYLGLRST